MSRELEPDVESNLKAILASPSYRLAERDADLLARPELRPVRMQLELFKPELALLEQKIASTIVLFGSTRIVERQLAEHRLEQARLLLAATPDDARRARVVAQA